MLNTKLLQFTNEIRNAVLIIHGENAHSYYMGHEAYENMIKGSYNSNKEFYQIPGADHTDLYDNLDVIPFEKIQTFINNNL